MAVFSKPSDSKVGTTITTSTIMPNSGPNSTTSSGKLEVYQEGYFDKAKQASGLYRTEDIDYFDYRFRFGIKDPNGQIGSCREYLFFTKPDLNIYPKTSDTITESSMQASLLASAYWKELEQKHFPIMRLLQYSLYPNEPFNHLLGNNVTDNLQIPGLNAEMIETPNNMYGVNIQYRGSSEASNDNFDFSLEFRDTKDLSVYHFFRAYEEYQTAKHHGNVDPWAQYVIDKILYDQYSIYKFLVDEDGETILYWAKLYGVSSKSLPRDTFSNSQFDNGITYSVDFHAAFFDDMNPIILQDFNNVAGISPYCPIKSNIRNVTKYPTEILNPFNSDTGRADMRRARAAYVVQAPELKEKFGYVPYKLKWTTRKGNIY